MARRIRPWAWVMKVEISGAERKPSIVKMRGRWQRGVRVEPAGSEDGAGSTAGGKTLASAAIVPAPKFLQRSIYCSVASKKAFSLAALPRKRPLAQAKLLQS